MRYRFTIRRLLIVTLLVAPVLAMIGSRHRHAWRRDQFSKQELARIAELCDRLNVPPEGFGTWTLVKSDVTKMSRATRFQLIYRDSASSREVEVDVFGGSTSVSRANLLARPSNPFTAAKFEGWIHKESRTETLNVDSIGATATTCHDSFAGTLNRTQQNMQAFCHDGEWSADLPTTNQSPYCGVNFKIQPDMNSWSSRVTDPLLVDFAQRFLAEMNAALTAPPTETQANTGGESR